MTTSAPSVTYPPPSSPPTSSIHTTTGVAPPGDSAMTGSDVAMAGAIGAFFFVLFIGTALLRYLSKKWEREL